LLAVLSFAIGLCATNLATAQSGGLILEHSDSWNLPKEWVLSVGNFRMEFVLIPAGSFLMGSPDETGDGDEYPRHDVVISQPFYLGKYEVTQEQWEEVMGSNPSRFRGAKLPVETVSWKDCQVFLAKLAAKTGRKFALPTEAQWEYACRAGTTTFWSFGDTNAAVDEFAWGKSNSGGQSHPVGGKKPNPWGLYDMHGNVSEWCADRYAKHTYSNGVVVDPVGPTVQEGSAVCRGGAWGDDPDLQRSAYRNCNGIGNAHHGIGLRCVLLVSSLPAPGPDGKR